MTLKIQPQKDITDILSGYVRRAQQQWARLPQGNVSWEQFNNQPFPEREIDTGYFTAGSTSDQLQIIVSKKELESLSSLIGADENTNLLIYGANSCMGWHTNSDKPGDRIYYTFTTGKGVFRYINDEGKIIDDQDNIGGWTARRFRVRADNPLWHTIWTEKVRFAFGFRVKRDV